MGKKNRIRNKQDPPSAAKAEPSPQPNVGHHTADPEVTQADLAPCAPVAEVNAPEAVTQAAAVAAPADSSSSSTPATGVPAVAGEPAIDSGVYQRLELLEQRNQQLTEENASLQQQLADLQKQLQALQTSAAAAQQVPVVVASPPADVLQLQERLLQLRNEQIAADAAKEAAWKQLKNIIGQVTHMAGSYTSHSASTTVLAPSVEAQ